MKINPENLDKAFIGEQTLRKECIYCSNKKVQFFLFEFKPKKHWWIASLCSLHHKKYAENNFFQSRSVIKLSLKDIFYIKIKRNLLVGD